MRLVVLSACLLGNAFAADTADRDFAKGARSSYKTDDHPKARRLKMKFDYPSGWTAKEGERPNIVQRFVEPLTAGITRMCMITVKEFPPEVQAASSEPGMLDEVFLPENLRQMVPPGATVLDAQSTKYDGQPGGWLSYSIYAEAANMKLYSVSLNQTFSFQGKMAGLLCSVGGAAAESAKVDRAFQASIPLFQQMGASIVLPDKWNAPVALPAHEGPSGTSASAAVGAALGVPGAGLGSLVAIIIFSLLLTWTIGLVPPLLIRYKLLKVPMSRGKAIATVVFFWFFNLILFTVLGSKSRTHGALLLIAYASYLILRREGPLFGKKSQAPTTTTSSL